MSRWNKQFIVKMIGPLLCQMCGNRRNKFLKGTLVCCLCAEKLSNRARAQQAAKENAARNKVHS